MNSFSPSIVSSNCYGGVVSHDLGLKFMSPTVNLWLYPEDYLKLCAQPTKFFSEEPTQIETNYSYPVGKILDITLYFQHYDDFEEARKKWIERSKRIDYNNLFFMMTERDGCTVEKIKRFDMLPYKNKVVFTHIPYPEFYSAFYIKGFEDKDECGILSEYRDSVFIRRYIDDFDVVQFLNRNK